MSESEAFPPLFDEFDAVAPAEWQEHVRSDLGGTSPEAFLKWSSLEGVSLPAYLAPEALREALHTDPEGGHPPLARSGDGPANTWTVCQPIGHPDPEVAGEHARAAVGGGADALQLAPPFLHAGAPDTTPRPADNLAPLLDGIDLADTPLHLGGGSAAPPLYALLREHLSGTPADPSAPKGSLLFDPVAAVASGADPAQAFSLADDLVRDAAELPHFRTVTVDTGPYHDAGASAVQELAAALGALAERLARSTERGLPLPALLDNLQVHVPVSTSYFVEMAKLRALRLLVPQVVDAFASETGASLSVAPADVFVHATTSRRVETIYDPYVNMLRATTEAMAAALGGCDALTIRPYDGAVRPPDEFGLRIARNTQLILRHEAHFDQVADPAAGSYYIETLTDRLAQRAWAQFQDLEAEGGIVQALRTGTLQAQIAETRTERRRALDERDQVLVGTTHYPALDERRRDDLVARRASSANGDSPASLDASSTDALRTALRDGHAPQDVASALQSDSSGIDPLPQVRLAEELEAIRLRTEAYAESHDGPPQVLLAPLGPPAVRSARSNFCRNFLGVAGFAITEPLKFESVDAVADAAVEKDADTVVLCSSNDSYADLAPALAAALADRDQEALLGIAGAPDDIDVDDAADFFVHQGSPLKETLEMLQDRLGIDVMSDP
ncbi:methylmalonyl-CoA mutase family protein [Salinibacter ruber]|uniref:methylmalonyl-CoA mutase family protein n=1 Tax=Salinibacter ruber TaxID=146919 RepID=UPI00216741F2|nr:methylmalonyl-CoA mutase family protein [Salinibacter ruber]MCS4050153.1 methylmalonyl-CoA mutase [Salinibacter ruber]